MFFRKITLLVFIYTLNLISIQANGLWNEHENSFPISNTCIGDSGRVQWLFYNNLSGVALDMDVLYHHPSFPQSPDRVEYVYSLVSPPRYNDFFGGMIRGYIKAPETGPYVFNITGDEKAVFQLSTDSLRSNMVKIAETEYATGATTHNNSPDQTSDTIQLVAGDFYYFEAQYIDSYGGDFVNVHWKIPSSIDTMLWLVVPGSSLFGDACQTICPTSGTVCDDGNINTINDIEDGACNCFGTPDTLTALTCAGDRGVIRALYYDTIPVGGSGGLSNLYNDADYPLSPNRAETLSSMIGPLSPGPIDQYGTRIRAFLRVPQTGYYQFNLTGDDQSSLWLTSNENAGPTDEVALLPSPVYDYNHDQFESQTSKSILLFMDSTYSLELNHVETYGGDDFFLFWKTPFAQDTVWRVLDAAYLYAYDCELACVPEGTPCNDGDSDTFDDQYDADCKCIGTPCSDPECTNALSYVPYEPCGDTDQHSTHETDSWVSCEPSPNPNPIRDTSNWLLYDFGLPYFFNSANVWNYNVMDSTGHGFHEVIIDYSLDGTTWIELDTFVWDQATGMTDYTGFTFSEFNGITAQYILFTALSSYDASGCVGLSEINFNANTCLGGPCDDNNPSTINDVYVDSCACIGVLSNCLAYDSIINFIPISSDTIRIENEIISAGEVKADSIVRFYAGYSITLLPGFVADSLSDFQALITPCEIIDTMTTDTSMNSLVVDNSSNPTEDNKILTPKGNKNNNDSTKSRNILEGELSLTITPNPSASWTNIEFTLPTNTWVDLEIFNTSGQLVYPIMNKVEMEAGTHSKRFPVQQLQAGVYYVSIKTLNGKITNRLVVLSL